MGIFTKYGQVRIHTTMDREDHKYCKDHGLKFAHLIRAAVRDHRVHTNDPAALESTRDLVTARDKAVQHRNKILKVLQDQLSDDQYQKFLDVLNA